MRQPSPLLSRFLGAIASLLWLCAVAGAGYGAGGLFASAHPSVRTASALRSGATETLEAQAIATLAEDPEAVIAEADRITTDFRRGGAAFGGWCGLICLFLLGAAARSPVRTEYEIDRKVCVSCARCFASCPQEILFRKQRSARGETQR